MHPLMERMKDSAITNQELGDVPFAMKQMRMEMIKLERNLNQLKETVDDLRAELKGKDAINSQSN